VSYPNYKHVGGYINTDPYFYEEPEPTDEELGWADDDSVPINIYGETEEEPE
jgi:hypothetical protein